MFVYLKLELRVLVLLGVCVHGVFSLCFLQQSKDLHIGLIVVPILSVICVYTPYSMCALLHATLYTG